MEPLFVVGSFWFFVILFVELVVLLICVSTENAFWATVSLIVVGAALHFFGDVNLCAILWNNPWKVVPFGVLYVTLGVLSSGLLFWWHYNKEVKKLIDDQENWFKRYKFDINNITPEAKEAWNKHIDDDSPKLWKYKARILGWGAYWPISLLTFLFADLFKEFFIALYDRLTMVFEHIAENIRSKAKIQ